MQPSEYQKLISKLDKLTTSQCELIKNYLENHPFQNEQLLSTDDPNRDLIYRLFLNIMRLQR